MCGNVDGDGRGRGITHPWSFAKVVQGQWSIRYKNLNCHYHHHHFCHSASDLLSILFLTGVYVDILYIGKNPGITELSHAESINHVFLSIT
jgi:hypothetical protein